MIERFKLSEEQTQKFLKNLLKFTAPSIGIFFAQLALGVKVEDAILVAILALYGVLSDYFKKLGK